MIDILSILEKYWGYPSFRKGQEAIIQSVLKGQDTLALMPTGGGKSITFQVPAMARPGICLVISPLLALMKDQVLNLKQLGILATYVGSDMRTQDIAQTLDNCIFGNYKFLYLSPERLGSELFQQKFVFLAKKTNLLVVDEAHCISQWGNDFRPNYRLIADIRDSLPASIPVLAVTASATPTVSVDICEQLHFSDNQAIFTSSFERENLTFVVRETTDKNKELVHILKSVSGSAIVYCRSRQNTTYYAKLLLAAGISASAFHAGLDRELKTQRQEAWISGQIRVLVATNAFGMGIDKGNVRIVVHTDFPDSLEAYYQEAGRAGRDGQRAYAVALITNRDIGNIRRRPSQSFPDKSYIRKVYTALCARFQLAMGYGEGMAKHIDIPEFLQTFKLDKRRVYASLQILSLSGYIKFEPYPNVPAFLSCSLKRKDIDEFLLEETPAAQLATLILRKYEGIFSVGSFIDVNMLARETHQSVEQVLKLLNAMRNIGFTYIPPRTNPKVTFTIMRTPLDHLVIKKTAYDDRLESFKQRINKVIDYLETKRCRQQMISAYFGMDTPSPCGSCDNCLRLKHQPSLNEKTIK